MKVYVYETVHEFMEENEDKLLEREAVTQLILFNGMVNRSSTTNDALLFGKVVNEEEKDMIYFCNALPYNLLINTANHRVQDVRNQMSDKVDVPLEQIRLKEAVRTLAEYMVSHNIMIKGLNANYEICEVFLPRYQELMNSNYKEHLAMDIMELRNLVHVPLADGFSRKADISEKELLAKWIVDFAKDALDEDLQYEEQLIKAERMIHSGIMHVYEIPGYGLVSMAAASRQLVHGVCINYVFTPKEYRGNGYAISNMYALSKEMLEKGNEFCTLFVDKKNPISNRVYKKIGYEIMDNQYDYKIE